MPDYDELHRKAREDIEVAISVWTDILGAESRQVKAAYVKGSAIKVWESPIDYVPFASDLDIHIHMPEGIPLLPPDSDFADAMNISEEYESRFIQSHPDHLHIPRPQVLPVNRLKAHVNYVPPRPGDVRMLFGDFESEPLPDIDTIRRIDIENLQEIPSFLESLPLTVIDRFGIEFWSVIRSMGWRVSPSPVRLLSQTFDDPLELWVWNRTSIMDLLEEEGYEEIVRSYRGFYMSAWDAFLSDFKDSQAIRACVKHGFALLKRCFEKSQDFSNGRV